MFDLQQQEDTIVEYVINQKHICSSLTYRSTTTVLHTDSGLCRVMGAEPSRAGGRNNMQIVSVAKFTVPRCAFVNRIRIQPATHHGVEIFICM